MKSVCSFIDKIEINNFFTCTFYAMYLEEKEAYKQFYFKVIQ